MCTYSGPCLDQVSDLTGHLPPHCDGNLFKKTWYIALMGLELKTAFLSLPCAETTDLYHLSHWQNLWKSPFGGEGVKEKTQGLRRLVALAEDWCSTPSTHVKWLEANCSTSPWGVWSLPWYLHTHTPTHTQQKRIIAMKTILFYFSKLSTMVQAYRPSYLLVWAQNVRPIHATQIYLKEKKQKENTFSWPGVVTCTATVLWYNNSIPRSPS